MYINYLKIALRNMMKYKGNSFISIIGLTIGMTVCFFLCLWVQDELTYDQFHEKSDRIYRSLWEAKYGDNSWRIPLVPMPLAGMMESEFPEIESATQVFDGRFTLKKGEEFVREEQVLFVDEQFFDIFTVEKVAGATKTAMRHPDALLITEEVAQRYFGQQANYQDIIGQQMERNDGTMMQIAGVVKGFPSQSHLQFDFLLSINNPSLKHLARRKEQWGSATLFTYFLMSESGDPALLADKVQQYVDANLSEGKGENYDRFPFEAITAIHLEPNLNYIWMFGIIAIFILLLASINYINLATARAMTRAKEVGIRKVLGSRPAQLVQQFFGESLLHVLFALILAILLAEIGLPYFNEFVGKDLQLNLHQPSFIWALLLALAAVTAILTGIVPAIVLSSISPIRVIKGQLVKVRGKDRLRQGLVIFQFCISSILIIGTLVVKEQLQYLQDKELGFEQEQVLIVRMANGLGKNYNLFLNKIKAMPEVVDASIAQYLPGDGFDSTIFVPEQPANYEATSLSYSHVGSEFVEVLDIQMAAGRNFNPALSTDSSAYLINETAAERLGWEDPVGRNIAYGGRAKGPIIGVVKDYNFASLHDEIEPLVLRLAYSPLSNIFIRLNKGNLSDQIQAIQSEWKTLAPASPFEFAFLDEEIQQLYDQEQMMSATFSLFALLAIFLACLGLFGLASFIALQRTKEIGIRKVLGASVSGIVTLLSKDFLKLVLIALLIASPLAYYLMEIWLEDFSYRTSIGFGVFAMTGLGAIAIAFLTVGTQSLKAALSNPGHTLRNE